MKNNGIYPPTWKDILWATLFTIGILLAASCEKDDDLPSCECTAVVQQAFRVGNEIVAGQILQEQVPCSLSDKNEKWLYEGRWYDTTEDVAEAILFGDSNDIEYWQVICDGDLDAAFTATPGSVIVYQ